MTETELIDKYICQHIEPEGDYLYRLYCATNIHTIHGRMAMVIFRADFSRCL